VDSIVKFSNYLCSLLFALFSVNMSNDYFRFKQFTVFQERCSMKVTTDGVLLGAWADIKGIHSALDVGTGSCLIALMIAQRSDTRIDAVEIDKPAFKQACENASLSPWKERIFIFHDSFQQFASRSQEKYDLVVSNPPYFIDSLKSPDIRKSKARHDVSLTFEELLHGVSSLIAEHGRFCIILPRPEQENFIELAHIYRLYCYRIMLVKTTPDAAFSRTLMAFGKNPGIPVKKSDFTIHLKNGRYTPEYVVLTREFYLTF
jgi:tRNA1Val (adenine37-N6)-methyltransferase